MLLRSKTLAPPFRYLVVSGSRNLELLRKKSRHSLLSSSELTVSTALVYILKFAVTIGLQLLRQRAGPLAGKWVSVQAASNDQVIWIQRLLLLSRARRRIAGIRVVAENLDSRTCRNPQQSRKRLQPPRLEGISIQLQLICIHFKLD